MGRTERLAQPMSFGKYELVARLAHGRMGDVYKGKSHGVEGFEKIFVVKVLNQALTQNPSFVEAVIEEAKRTVTLSHANVAQVFDLGLEEASGQYYVAQEFVGGFDLRRTLELSRVVRPLPYEIAMYIASEIAKGLDYAHRRKDYNFNSLNLVHGDLSPRNVMLSFEGEVKVTDFGLARAFEFIPVLDDEDGLMRIKYAAPEVLKGAPRSQRADLYSLGLLLWEMLAGHHPYDAANLESARRKAEEADVPSIQSVVDVPRPIAQLLEMLLTPDPAGRVETANQAYEDMAAFIFGNNLRADARALSLYIRELKRHEQKIEPSESTMEFGIPEISLSEIKALNPDSEAADRTNAEIPSHKIMEAMGGPSRPALPGALEEIFLSVRGGRGKAVLVDGDFGRGREFLADILQEGVAWRGNTLSFSAQISQDDRFVPFGLMGDMVATLLGVEGERNVELALRDMGISEEAIETYLSVRVIGRISQSSPVEKSAHLLEIVERVVSDATETGPLVVVIDRLEEVDSVSLNALRHLVEDIGTRSLMLVMFTQNAGAMRAAFNLGHPENLEALRVSGEAEADLSDHVDFTPDESQVLAMLAIAAVTLTPSDLTLLTGLPSDRVMKASTELVNRGLVRAPQTGIFLIGSRATQEWLYSRLSFMEIEQRASAFARILRQRAYRTQSLRHHATLIRCFALAGDRRRMLREGQNYSKWLENGGWYESALEFYQHAASLVGATRVGTPQARIGFLLNRAELALQMARIDLCRTSLEPVQALSEMVRSDVAAVRGQLLLGQMAMQEDDLDEAHRHFKRALESARSLHDPDLLAFGMLASARWHHRYGDSVASQALLDGALHLYERYGTYRMDLQMRALLLNRATRIFSSRGMLTRARSLVSDLERMAESSPLATVRIRALWARAVINNYEGKHADASNILNHAIVLAQSHGLVALEIETLRELAISELLGGRYRETINATGYLLQLSEIHRDFYSTQRALDLQATASCMLGVDTQDSLNHLQTSLIRAKEREVPKDILRCHQNLAKALEALGRHDEAEFHKAQTLSSRGPGQSVVAQSLHGI